MPSFSTSLEQAIHGALALANEHRHELATLEHLLLALVQDEEIVPILATASLLNAVEKAIDRTGSGTARISTRNTSDSLRSASSASARSRARSSGVIRM